MSFDLRTMIVLAALHHGFVQNRKAPRDEPLDKTDWENIEAAGHALRTLVNAITATPFPATSSRPGPAVRVEPCHTSTLYSPAGVSMALRQIHHRGQLVPGDRDAIHAAIRLIEGMS